MANNHDNKLWLQSWREDRIDFHQTSVNQFLKKFWPILNLPKDSRIFVPLCGKSLDMLWLAKKGYQVIGIELSAIAVRDFFRENGMQPTRSQTGKFTLWKCDNIRILCGDYFNLSPKDLGNIDMVYDRAALTALPEETRKRYVTHLFHIISSRSNIFLLTIEDAEEHQTMTQALGIGDEIRTLYTKKFDISLTHVESLYETDLRVASSSPVRVEYKVYQLNRKSEK